MRSVIQSRPLMNRVRMLALAVTMLCVASGHAEFGNISDLEVISAQPVNQPYVELALRTTTTYRVMVVESQVDDDRLRLALVGERPPGNFPPQLSHVNVVVVNVPASAQHIDIHRGHIDADTLLASVPVEIAPGPFPFTEAHLSAWPPDPMLAASGESVLEPVWVLIEPPNACQGLELIATGPVTVEVHETAPDCELYAVPRRATLPLEAIARQRDDTRKARVFVDYVPFEGEVQRHYLEIPARADTLSSRMAGSWYDPAQSGQGINLEIPQPDQALLYWYTFDQAGDPAWIVALGESHAAGAVLDAYRVTGGAFPPSLDPDQVQRVHWGEIELSFTRCDQGLMVWTTEQPGFSAGAMPLARLTWPSGNGCGRPPPEALLNPTWLHDAPVVVVLPGSGD